MNKFLINSIILFLTTMTSLMAHPSYNDPNRIQQVLPSENGKQTLLQLRKPDTFNFEYQLFHFTPGSKIIKSLPIKNHSQILAVWGPNANELTYVEPNSNNSKIIIFNIQTQQKHLLISIPGQVTYLNYSANFSKLAMAVEPTKKNEIYYLEGEVKNKQQLVIYNLLTKQTLTPLDQTVSISPPLQWFRDEERLLIKTQPSEDYFDSWHGKIGILSISKKIVTAISENNDLNENPILSQDESFIAYLTNEMSENKRPKVFQFKRVELYNITKTVTTRLPETNDGAPNLTAFAKNDKAILYTEAKQGSVQFNTIETNPPYQQHQLSQGPGMISTLSVNHNASWIGYASETPTKPAKACVMSLSNLQEFCLPEESKSIDLTNINYEAINYFSKDGKTIQAFLITPKHYSGPLPTIILAHGGPTYHNFQGYIAYPYSLGLPFVPADYAKKGYAVFMPNIRGSIGYGPEFRMENYQDVGGADFQDLLAGINYLVTNKIADKNKLGIFGWSYGGFLCEYAATQTKLFKAAVCGAAISDWISHDATSEFKAYTSGYFGKKYSRDFSKTNLLLEKSPALQIKYHTTPILLLHGTADRAVNFEQGLEFYWAYKKAGGITQLAVFPGEDHGFAKHQAIQAGINLTKLWFNQYLK